MKSPVEKRKKIELPGDKEDDVCQTHVQEVKSWLTCEWTSSMICPRGVMVKAMDCRIVVNEFELQSRYSVYFWANTLGKGMNPFILPAMD